MNKQTKNDRKALFERCIGTECKRFLETKRLIVFLLYIYKLEHTRLFKKAVKALQDNKELLFHQIPGTILHLKVLF